MAGIGDVNRHPVIHTWSYKLAEAARSPMLNCCERSTARKFVEGIKRGFARMVRPLLAQL